MVIGDTCRWKFAVIRKLYRARPLRNASMMTIKEEANDKRASLRLKRPPKYHPAEPR